LQECHLVASMEVRHTAYLINTGISTANVKLYLREKCLVRKNITDLKICGNIILCAVELPIVFSKSRFFVIKPIVISDGFFISDNLLHTSS